MNTQLEAWTLPEFCRVSEMPQQMAEPDTRGQYRPLIQFAMHWNRLPEHRTEMLDGPPPKDGSPFHLAAIASVVHALATRDGLEVPDWVHHHRADPPRTLSGIPTSTEYGRIVEQSAPSTCAQHGVYFDPEILNR